MNSTPYPSQTEAGGALLGYEVDIHAQVEFVQVKEL
jgi:hypothetical protein